MYIFIRENAFENIVCKMPAIMFRPQCINPQSATPLWIRYLCSAITVRTNILPLSAASIHRNSADFDWKVGCVFFDVSKYVWRHSKCPTRSHEVLWDFGYYNGVIMREMASETTSLTIVYSTVCSSAGQRKNQSSAWLAFVSGIHRWPVNSPHKGPVTRKMFPFDDVIMIKACIFNIMLMVICYKLPLMTWWKIPPLHL